MKLNFAHIAILLGAAAAAPVGVGHAAGESGGVNGYDFSYSIAGDSKVTPIQVFDDGAKTYFQFKTSENMPAIFLVHKGKQDLAQIVFRSPYIVVSGLGQRFALRSGTAIASVDYVGGRRNDPALPTARAAIERSIDAGASTAGNNAAADGTAAIEQLVAAIRKSIKRVVPTLAVDPAAETPVGNGAANPGPRTILRKEVPFYREHSTLGKLGTKALIGMIVEARLAERVVVTARPDSNEDTQLAAARGGAIKDFLVSQGVSAERIEVVEHRTAKPSGSRDVFLCEVSMRRAIDPAGDTARDASARARAETVRSADETAAARVAQPSAYLLPVFTAAMALLKDGKITQEAAAAVLATVVQGHSDATEPPAQPLPLKPVWEMSRTDGTLRSALYRWAGASGWQLSWEIPFDYPINMGAQFQGSFEEAVASVAKTLEQAEVPIQVTFYRANKVMRVLSGGKQKQ